MGSSFLGPTVGPVQQSNSCQTNGRLRLVTVGLARLLACWTVKTPLTPVNSILNKLAKLYPKGKGGDIAGKEKPANMTRLTFLLTLAIAAMTVACSDYERLERKEDRLIGAWEFDKAFYKDDTDLFRDDVYDQFRRDIIEFYGDYSAVYDDYSAGEIFDGDWQMSFERFYDDWEDDSEVEFYLDMTFWDHTIGESFSYYTRVTYLTKQKMTLKAHTRNGVYTFKFRKI